MHTTNFILWSRQSEGLFDAGRGSWYAEGHEGQWLRIIQDGWILHSVRVVIISSISLSPTRGAVDKCIWYLAFGNAKLGTIEYDDDNDGDRDSSRTTYSEFVPTGRLVCNGMFVAESILERLYDWPPAAPLVNGCWDAKMLHLAA